MGLVPDGAVQSHVIAQPEFMWPVPSHWNLEDAATVPLAYLYAYYISLHVKVRISISVYKIQLVYKSVPTCTCTY